MFFMSSKMKRTYVIRDISKTVSNASSKLPYIKYQEITMYCTSRQLEYFLTATYFIDFSVTSMTVEILH